MWRGSQPGSEPVVLALGTERLGEVGSAAAYLAPGWRARQTAEEDSAWSRAAGEGERSGGEVWEGVPGCEPGRMIARSPLKHSNLPIYQMKRC